MGEHVAVGEVPGVGVTTVAPVRLAVAGALTIVHGAGRVADRDVGSPQLRLVIALLLLDRDRDWTSEQLADELWPAGPPQQWRPALRGLVSRVRRLLDDVGVDAEQAITSHAGRYVVDLPELEVDVEVALAQLDAARSTLERGDPDLADELAGRARAVLSRPVLPGVDGAWLDATRDRLAMAHVESLLVLGRARHARGRLSAAGTALRACRELAPLREDVVRELMLVEHAAGNSAVALEVFDVARRQLADELGVDPSAATQEVHTRILTDLPAAPERHSGNGHRAPRGDRPPYVGLRPFEVEDGPLFFGRDAAVQELVERLGQHRAVAVVGPSGIGKSSLVRAGLVPALQAGALPDSDTWPVAVLTPGRRPIRSLASALADVDLTADAADVEALEAGLRHDPGHALAALLPADDARLVLVIDQAEELLTLAEPGEADALIGCVAAAVRRADSAVRVVVVLRADLYAEVARDDRMARLLSTAQLVVPPLSAVELEAAIVEPLRLVGGQLGPGVLARILADSTVDSGLLPLLQFALRRMWEDAEDGVIDLAVHDRVGGVAGALVAVADGAVAGLDEARRAAVRRMLLHLVAVTEDHVTRRREPLDEVVALPGVERQLVERLAAARLLTVDVDRSTGQATVELSHDALTEVWPRLRGWIAEARTQLLEVERLRVDAAAWQASDRDPDLLYTGGRLRRAIELLAATDVAPAHAEFVEAASAAAEATARAEAERESRVARARQSRRRAVAVGVVFALVAASASAIAIVSRNASDRDRAAAQRAALLSTAAGAVESQRDLGLLLAVEAYRRQSGPAEQQVLLDALRQHEGIVSVWASRAWDGSTDGFCVTSPEPGRVVVRPNAVPFSADGGPPGGIVELDVVGHRVVREVDAALHCTVVRTPPGQPVFYAGTRGRDGGLVVMDEDGATLLEVDDLTDPIFLPDGRLVARPQGAETVEWVAVDPASGTREPSGIIASNIEPVPGGGDLLWLGPAPPLFASGDLPLAGWPGVSIVDADTLQPVASFEERLVRSAAVASADGSVVAAATWDDTVVVVDATDGTTLLEVGGLEWAVGLSPDGARLATVDDAGIVTLYDVADGRLLRAVPVSQGSVVGLDVADDGTVWATLSTGLVVTMADGAPGIGERMVPCCAGEVFAAVVPDAEPNPLVILAGQRGGLPQNVAVDGVTGREWPAVDMSELIFEQRYVQELRFPPDGHALLFGDPFRVRRVGIDGAVGPELRPLGDDLATTDSEALHFVVSWRQLDGQPHILIAAALEGPPDQVSRLRIATLDSEANVVDGPHDVTLDHPGSILPNVELRGGMVLVERMEASGTIDVLDPGGAVVGTLEVGAARKWLVLSPDHRHAIWMDAADDAIHWLDRDTGRQQILPISGQGQWPLVTPDGRAVLHTRSGQVQLWDLAGPTRIGTLAHVGNPADTWAGLDADGSELWLAVDGWYRRVPLDAESWVARACTLAGRSLTPQEWTDLVPGDEPYRDACATP